MFLIRVSISDRIQPKIFHIFRLMTVAETFTRKISPAPLLQRGVIDCETAAILKRRAMSYPIIRHNPKSKI